MQSNSLETAQLMSVWWNTMPQIYEMNSSYYISLFPRNLRVSGITEVTHDTRAEVIVLGIA